MLLKAKSPWPKQESEKGDGLCHCICELENRLFSSHCSKYLKKIGKCSLWLAKSYCTSRKPLWKTVLWFWWGYSVFRSLIVNKVWENRKQQLQYPIQLVQLSTITLISSPMDYQRFSSAAKIKLLGLSKSQVSVQFSKTAVCIIICAVKNLKEESKSDL